MESFVFGVDIGGTSIKLGLFGAGGILLRKWDIPTRTDESGVHILPAIAHSVRVVAQEESIVLSQIMGIGIGVPGPVLADGTVNRCVNLGWDVLSVERILSSLLDGLPVRACNDANAAALGEMWQGGGKGNRTMAMLTLGTGVGGGIIIDGQVVPGAFGAGGEIGHFQVNSHEEIACSCGKKGCLEQYASATGIVCLAKERLRADTTPSALRALSQLTAKAIFDAAKAADPLACQIVDRVCQLLGLACSHISCVVDPQVFVFGGGVAQAGNILLSGIQTAFSNAAFHASRGAQFRLAELGNDAGIYGGAGLFLCQNAGGSLPAPRHTLC